MEIKLALAEKMIGGFKKGSIYAIATRPGVGKTHFCISVATLFASRNQKVLYIANSISEEEFCDRQKAFEVDCGNNIFFNEIYSLDIEKLDKLASEQEFDLIILDPVEIYLLDIDLGELKEWTKKKNITVLVSKYLSRPPLESDRDHPLFVTVYSIARLPCTCKSNGCKNGPTNLGRPVCRIHKTERVCMIEMVACFFVQNDSK